jgi:hypothetical protein
MDDLPSVDVLEPGLGTDVFAQMAADAQLVVSDQYLHDSSLNLRGCGFCCPYCPKLSARKRVSLPKTNALAWTARATGIPE